jgi:REP element-mobilizing transposase RayT
VNYFEFETTETEQKQRETVETQPDSQTFRPASTPERKPAEKTLPSGPGRNEAVGTETVPQYSYDLSYSCLLIPRFAEHYLVGDITQNLTDWMKQICISYGWRLEAILIRPGYFHWVMTVPMTANPAHFMRLARQQTSMKIFEEFPRYKQKNLSGDFWAPGYFVAAGNQLQSAESINNFIVSTRKYQGIF